MARFEVWAPAARERVEVEIDGERIPMACSGRDVWSVDVSHAGPGTDYAFRIDGGEPRPDPRSNHQPHGVHGPSRLVDHGAFSWTDQGWRPVPLSAGVLYELHIGTFTQEGTFESAVGRLGHLVDLGITHVEVMPIAEFSGGRGWGYDGVDLYAPHHAYGGPDGFKRFVDACHGHGLAVILDVVYNHLGPEGGYLSQFGPYFTDRYRTPWGDAVNFDGYGSTEVRAFFIENALMWFRDYHVDALRLDAVHALIDMSAKHFLEELADEVEALEAHLARTLTLIAESDLNDPRILKSPDAGGYGFHAQWVDDLHHALHVMLTGERSGYYQDYRGMSDLVAGLERGFVFTGRFSPHRGRTHGRPLPSSILGHRLVTFVQNHDHIGNRAKGERISQLASPGRLKIGAAILFTAPMVPMLFQGEEWGASTPFIYFTDHGDPDLAKAVREGRRREFASFGWNPEDIPDPQDRESFLRSKLDWNELSATDHADLLEWHRRLARIRRGSPTLTDGRMEDVEAEFDEGEQWLVIRRNETVLACNLSGEPREVRCPGGGACAIVLASDEGVRVDGAAFYLPPETVVIARTQ